jgi:hypothetical protein
MIKPTDAAFAKVEKQYPDRTPADKYRLAQAQTLLDSAKEGRMPCGLCGEPLLEDHCPNCLDGEGDGGHPFSRVTETRTKVSELDRAQVAAQKARDRERAAAERIKPVREK